MSLLFETLWFYYDHAGWAALNPNLVIDLFIFISDSTPSMFTFYN